MMIQMSGETVSGTKQRQHSSFLLVEIAIPILSFGGAGLAFVASVMGSQLDVRYFAIGCVIASILLAYLAWIRPHKDIVALSTPIYSFLFFILPSDAAVNIFLELLYAVSLTILLIRLKFRFGWEISSKQDGKTLEEPLSAYCESIHEPALGLSTGTAHSAAIIFTRFSEADYREAAKVAGDMMVNPGLVDSWPPLATAFAIVREQALLLEQSADQPEQFVNFSNEDTVFLAKPVSGNEKNHALFERALENALILLFATAWNASDKDRPLLLTGQGFALNLIAP
jgi:hypothetical protein